MPTFSSQFENRTRDGSVKSALEKCLPNWEEKDGLIFYKNAIYVPRNTELWERIIKFHHDRPLVGHPREHRTQELIERNYWWPRLGNQVREYVRTCETCQRSKVKRFRTGELHPHEITAKPWETISMDLIGPLPQSSGYDAIQVWVDTCTKRVHIEPTNMEITSEGIAKLTRDRVIRYHGVPRKIISDRDPRYVSAFMQELSKSLGFKLNTSTAYHPQTDGQTERMNQEIEQYLRIYINFHQNDWSDWLSLAEFTINDKVNSSIQTTPFFADHGYHPWKGTEVPYISKNETAKEFTQRMKKI